MLRPFLTGVASLVLVFWFSALQAQSFKVSGRLLNQKNNEVLVGATLLLSQVGDSSIRYFGSYTANEHFEFTQVKPGRYNLAIRFIGFVPKQLFVTVDADKNLGDVYLFEDVKQLKDVLVKEDKIAIKQSGDTAEFDADAFKTNKDASAGELLQKIPGVTVEGGKVKIQGEDLKEVLVDGKPFFGKDPNAALQTLPAEMIQKLQVYDAMSDQSRLSGIEDGNTIKTLNIVTKIDYSNGQFGKAYVGYGYENKWNAGGNLNIFGKKRRFTFLLLSNNINQQNFSTEDLSGALGSSTQRGGGQGRPQGFGGFGASNGEFLIGSQNGISVTNSFGLNYSEDWGEKLKLTASYFFNHSDNENLSNTNRQFLNSSDSSLVYTEKNESETRNLNNRFNACLTYNLSDKTTLIYSPRLSYQSVKLNSNLSGENTSNNSLLNGTENIFDLRSNAFNLQNNLVLNQKFTKKGRNLSLSINASQNQNLGVNDLAAANRTLFSNTNLTQEVINNTKSQSYEPNITYTEPINDKINLNFAYRPVFSRNEAFRETEISDSNIAQPLLDTALSNDFYSTYHQHIFQGGIGLNGKKIKANINLNYQLATLKGIEEFPGNANFNRPFRNFLPSAFIRIEKSKTENYRIFYRSFTSAPSASQLQEVYNNNNPVSISTGNLSLIQENSHSIGGRFLKTNPAKGSSFFIFASVTGIFDYIGTSTEILRSDSAIANSEIVLPRGAQLSKPVNLDGYRQARSFMSYSFPLKYQKFKSNLSFNLGYSYVQRPGLVQGLLNLSQTNALNLGTSIASNISTELDFNISYNAGINLVNNSILPQNNNNFINQTASARFNWITKRNFIVASDLNFTGFSGLNAFNQTFLLWNLSFGKKVMKDERGDLRISVFDLLNQNNNITRNVTETYIEDAQTLVLRRFVMLSFVYRIRNFGKVPEKPQQEETPVPYPFRPVR